MARPEPNDPLASAWVAVHVLKASGLPRLTFVAGDGDLLTAAHLPVENPLDHA